MEKAQLDRYEELEHPLPEGSNRELYGAFFAALKEKKAKWMDESKDYCKSEYAMTGFHLNFWHFVGVYSASNSEKPSKSKVSLPISKIVGQSITTSSSQLDLGIYPVWY